MPKDSINKLKGDRAGGNKIEQLLEVQSWLEMREGGMEMARMLHSSWTLLSDFAGEEESKNALSSKDNTLLVSNRVTLTDIAKVVAKMTGIPVQNFINGERERLLGIENELRKQVLK
ncbi:hypothetical protein BY996DRAFT_6521223 [Phakopsora pachyrhizi]|nr:hypothetical protein BY996DRAFT_6521223 [Phakopsora pachyrhizi]